MTPTPSRLSEERLREIERLADAVIASGREYYHDLKVLDVEVVDDFALEADPATVAQMARELREAREALRLIANGPSPIGRDYMPWAIRVAREALGES